MRKTIAFLTVFVMSVSLFAQSDMAKYGDKGAPEVRIPQTWHSNTNRTEDFLLVLTDSFGDGWNGASLDVSVNGTLVYVGITLDDYNDDGSSAIFTLAVDDGDVVQTAFTSGSYDSEIIYAFYDNNGTLVASDGPYPGAGIEFTVSESGSHLVINEIMADPTMVSDVVGEWFEIYNAEENSVDLNGYYFTDADGDSFAITSSLLIQPMQYFVLGCNGDQNSNGGFSVDFTYNRSDFNLDNTEDEVIFYDSNNNLIDIVQYNNTFPYEAGASLELTGLFYDNNNGSFWATSIIQYGLGDFGTPGDDNSTGNFGLIIHDQYGNLTDTLNFGQVDTSVSSNQHLEITNFSEPVLELTNIIINNDEITPYTTQATISFGETYELSILWSPNVIGNLFDSLFVMSNADTLGTIYLAGEAIGVSPIISVESTQLTFPWISPGDTATQSISIINYSNIAALYISSIAGDNDAFFTSADIPFSISPNGSENIEILFNPDTAGSYNNFLTIESNDQTTPTVMVELFGGALFQDQHISVNVNEIVFSSSVQGLSLPPATFEIFNAGQSDLMIDDIFATPPFSADPTFGVLTPSSSMTVTITVSSSDETQESLTIYSNDPDQPEVVIPLSVEYGDMLFVNDQSTPMTQDGGASSGTAIVDINGDGLQDFLVANRYGSPNHYYIQENDGTFISHDFNMQNDSENITIADLANDGGISMIITHLTSEGNADAGATYVYCPEDEDCNSSEPSFDESSFGSNYNSLNSSFYDANYDGWLDLFIAINEAENLFYLHFGFTSNGWSMLNNVQNEITESGYGSVCTWADYDNDGYGDLFVGNQQGQNDYLYKNNGDGSFTKILDNNLVNYGGNTIGASWGDFNNDGLEDIFITRYEQQSSTLYKNIQSDFVPFLDIEQSTYGSSWGDLNNDGWLDLVITSGGGGNYIYLNNGNETFTPLSIGNGDSRGVSLGDMDNDGDLDIYIANRSDENNFVFINQGNDNHWININCIGTETNRSAIGTKVLAKATINGEPIWQKREISSQTGGGFGGQNSLNVEFGLGDALVIDSLVIKWQLGLVETYTNVSVDTFLTLIEGELNYPPTQFSLLSPSDESITALTNDNLNESLTFSWQESNDPDGDIVTYEFIGLDGLSVLNSLNSTNITENTSLEITYSSLAQVMVDSSLEELSGLWTIIAYDNVNSTMALDTFSLTIDGAELGINLEVLPEVFALHQNYPNPFNPITQIKYDLPEDALVSINIYDLMGRIVSNLVSSQQNAGYKSIQWNATNNQGQPVSAGLYLYTIQAGEFRQTKKMVLLK